MKTLDQLRNQIDDGVLTESNKLSTLVKAGLFDASKLTLLKRAMSKDNEKLTRVEKNALIDLLDRLIAVVTNDNSVFNKIKSDVMTEESKVDIDVTILPPILILKRRAIRVFPDGQKVALYWADRINKYISVPFQSTGLSEAARISKDDLDKNPSLAQAVADAEARAAAENPPTEEPETPAEKTPPKEEEKPVKNFYKRISPKAQRTMDRASEMRQTIHSDFKNDYSTIRRAGVGIIPSLAGAAGVSMRRASIKSALTNRGMTVKESFALKYKVPEILVESDDNPFEWKRERPAKAITTPLKGRSPSRPENTIDPYEDPDSSIHQQQQNIQRRANRNFASGGNQGPGRVYEDIVKIAEGTTNGEITINESTILVTPAMARNIVKLYENVNRVNKAVIKNKLCESEESFFKILDFAVKKV